MNKNKKRVDVVDGHAMTTKVSTYGPTKWIPEMRRWATRTVCESRRTASNKIKPEKSHRQDVQLFSEEEKKVPAVQH